MKTFKSINPFDQQPIAEYPLMNNKQLDATLDKAKSAFSKWRKTTFAERRELLNTVAKNLRNHKAEYARMMSLEMGKVLSESLAEIEKCAVTCNYYADHGEEFLKDEPIPSESKRSFIAFQPLGTVLAIMPWNFPFWQVFRFAAPAVMAGNTVLLKHAPNVCGCALEIEKTFLEAGAPDGLFQTLIIDIDVMEKIISSDGVQGATVTGSERAGSSVAALAGKYIKKSVLELGGSDPLIVLEDADLDKAAEIAVQSRMRNAGQSCIAAKRFIVVEKVKDAFTDKVISNIKQLKQGNPLEDGVTFGPMARLDLADKLQQQMEQSISNNTVVVLGGKRNGCNFQPTLLLNAKEGSPVFDEEIFGPVATIMPVKNDDEALALANKTSFGLGAAVWTKDPAKGEFFARNLNAGSVFINGLVRSDPRFPFGGIHKSGYGRELSEHGIKEFINVKTIVVDE
jgi:succinate-semialdehyde dehydrogenase / glutarate-semialdehyde dehydrogenase